MTDPEADSHRGGVATNGRFPPRNTWACRLGVERTRYGPSRVERGGREFNHVHYALARHSQRVAWNKGRIVGQKRPLQPKHVWSIRVRLEMADNPRDLALFNMAIDSKLRGCDLVHLRVRDVFAAGQVKERASITQRKTGRPVRFEITEPTRQSLERWIANPEMEGAEFLSPSRFHDSPHLSTRQYARILRGSVTSIGLEPSAFGTHSMRRTKVAQIYRKTGNLRAVQLLLGHTKMDSTVRYLGVELDDALTISEAIDL